SQTLQELESEMAALQEVVGSGSTTDERLDASAKFEDILIEAFDFKETFEYPFAALPKLVKHSPDDEEFRMFNWNIPLDEGQHAYRMYVLFPNGKYQRFDDSQELKHEDESIKLKPEDWYGALYYELHSVKVKRDTYYTLIGWDGNDELTTKKVLEVLVLEKKNKVSLGFPIFEKDDDLVYRRVFEYAKEGVMNLKWLEPKEMIIFDRLEPKTQNLEGNYAFYGPGTAHNGYEWEGGYWKLHEFIDMSRPKSSETGAQFNFPERPDLNRKREKTNPLIGK
ncbi:MAG TPA: hypothetical protein VJ949_11470, partial [Cryomorphaceae bacterium]|nr:hypothetical protein [Cryomorphaceae bacterium]